MAFGVVETEIATRRVLIVDDDIDLAETLQGILAMDSFEAALATDSRQALYALGEFAPEVALVDVRLGTESGTELIGRLREVQPGLITVVLTAFADMETAVASLKHGAYDFLRKPVEPQVLVATLNRCFEKLDLEREKKAATEALWRKNEELAEINHRLRRISESTRALTTCPDIEAFGSQLLEEFARNMAAEGGSIYLREQGRLRLAASIGPIAPPAALPLPLDQASVFGRVVSLGVPMVLRDIAEERMLNGSGASYYKDGSLIAFPIRSVEREDVCGVIALHNKSRPPFTDQDRELGCILASFSYERLNSLRAVQALVASEERYRLLADAISDVIWACDRDFRFTYFSPSLSKWRGFESESLIGQHIMVRAVPGSEAAAEDAMQAARRLTGANTDSVVFELEYQRSDGSTVWAESRINVLVGPDLEPIGYVGLSRDVSERRRLEEEARQRQAQLLQADKLVSLGTLVAGVAHEINNPNQIIMSASEALDALWRGASEIMQQHQQIHGDVEVANIPIGQLVAEGSELIGMLEDAADRIKRIVHDLRDFARQDPGALTEQVDVRDAIARSARLLGSTLRKSTRGFQTEYAPDLPMVRGNRQRLEQVFINLLQNACQALRDSSQSITVRAWREADMVVIEVEDQGVGMPEELLAQITNPFFTTKRESGGTGLGLSVSSAIVKQHAGTLQFSSAPGKGTTARVTLPADPETTSDSEH